METYESEFEDSLELARALLAGNEDLADLWEANDLANRALTLRPDDAEAWVLKAQILSALDDDVAALASIEMALRRNPFLAEAHYWQAAIYMDLERYEDALMSIDAAFATLGSDDDWLLEELYHEKAGIQEALGQREEAFETLREGLEQCPESSILQAGLRPLQRERMRAMFKVIPGGLR